MLSIYVSCVDAEVDIPDKVNHFFDWEDPRELLGREVDLYKQGYAKKFKVEGKDGFTIDLSKLPPEVKFIRFYNSY